MIVLGFSINSYSQNKEKTLSRLKTLCSEEYHGRGYVNNGCNKAADYLAEEMKKIGLKPFGKDYFQDFTINVNTFKDEIEVKINDKPLVAGVEFLIGSASPATNTNYQLYKPDSILLNDTVKFKDLLNKEVYKDMLLVIDYPQIENNSIKKFYRVITRYNKYFGGIVELIDKELMWTVSTYQNSYPIVQLKRTSYPANAKNMYIKVNPKFEKDYKIKNVIGYLEGETDEYIVFTAHYDHLGRMGKDVYIPGASDNGSGTAMVLDFADYYSKLKNKYSIVFIFFAGEEAGLFGSIHYVQHPFFDLSKIKMVLNLDIVGTGDDGITIVNGAAKGYEKIWNTFETINNENKFFDNLKPRGETANSDHYPFHAKGVPAVFIYTMGGNAYYHNPKDKPEYLSLAGYNSLFKLLVNFVNQYE